MKSRSAPTVLGLAVSLFLPSLMFAQLDRSRPPAPGPPPQVHLAEYSSFTLSNGMRVIVVENQKLPLVSVQVRFDIPPVLQGDRAGYIDMLGEVLATGTAKRTKAQIDEEVDQVGAQFFTTSDGVYASGLKRHLPALLDLVEDVVTNSTFPDKEFDRVRTRYASSVMQRKDDADAISEAVGRSVTYSRTHPYGEVASEKSIANVSVDNIKAYYSRFFRPEKGYLVFVGDITIKEAKDLSKKHFNKWKVPLKTLVNEDGTETIDGLGVVRFLERPLGPSGQRRVAMVDRPGAAQSVIRVSFPLNLQPKDIRSMSAQVMNTILGGGVFNARLMQNLRETKAFTYGAYSNLEIDRFNGSFTATVSVRTEVTDSAITEIMNELYRMRSMQVTNDELQLAKSYMAGSFARSLEDPRTVARFALNTFLNDLPKDHYATYLQRLEAITAQDVEAAAQAFLQPDNAIIFVVGDKEKIEYKLPQLATDPNTPLLVLDENGEMFREKLIPVPDLTAQQ
ncbi:MAG: insulinase family protein, partial [Bacteroidota bacterium]|nr:insulinase family protein [Bacteroidota bacterium]